jgi:predicted lipoprotein
MKLARSLSLVLAIAAVGAPTGAAQDEQHQAHHPAGAASAPAPKAVPGKIRPEVARMDSQMKAMREMHDKMMAAKTPEDRTALMADHMKTMQDGMTMMSGMSPGGMGSMKGDMAGHHQMMEKRMEMMQATMQMMMDRLPITPMK